ncbi:MAG: Nif3-like dinuclear metal center hexameric protein [Campylobacterota bacterium]|nr:Nif3-like dinuclear metal center hexameric protein [Campylobacterota bacterium]
MLVREIHDYLDQLSPFESQEKWDNSGLIVGSMDQNFDELVISLDLDEELLSKVKPNSLIITHHPLIFSPLKTINFDSYATKLLKILIKKDIALISMHTNIDKSHLNRYVATQVLEFQDVRCEEFVCYADVNMSFEKLQQHVVNKLGLKALKVTQKKDHVQTVALTTGSGMSLIGQIQADCFLTGDIKYHDAMEAKSREINLIDIGHHESEQHFTALLMGLIEKYLKKNQIKAIIANSQNPFDYK